MTSKIGHSADAVLESIAQLAASFTPATLSGIRDPVKQAQLLTVLVRAYAMITSHAAGAASSGAAAVPPDGLFECEPLSEHEWEAKYRHPEESGGHGL